MPVSFESSFTSQVHNHVLFFNVELVFRMNYHVIDKLRTVLKLHKAYSSLYVVSIFGFCILFIDLIPALMLFLF